MSLTFIIIVTFVFIGFLGSIFANNRFNKNVESEIQELFEANKETDTKIVEESDIDDLPKNVQRWLKRANVLGQKKINTVRLKQNAKMRMEKDKSWMPVEAEQYFTVNRPGFIWKARIKAAPFLHIVGRDKYFEGEGNMLIKMMSLVTIADSSGPEIDQGTLIRYLAETVWFPSAALEVYITWEHIDDNSAKATMTYGDITSSGTFVFNEKGDVIRFEANRYRESDGDYSKERWIIDIKGHKEMNGIRIPTKGEVTWKLDHEDFTWFRFEIEDIDYHSQKTFISY
ncbi:MAG: DUF6544 family protein [Thermoplasmatota archaeon]